MPEVGFEPTLAFSANSILSAASLPVSPFGLEWVYSPQSEELDAYLRTVRYSSWSFTELVQRAPFQVVVRVKAI